MKFLTHLLLITIVSFSFAGRKRNIVSRIEQKDSIPVFFVAGMIDAYGERGVCNGQISTAQIPDEYRALMESVVFNMNTDYKTDAFYLVDGVFSNDSVQSIKPSDLDTDLFAVFEISGTYITQQDFTANRPGKYEVKFQTKSYLSFYTFNEEGEVDRADRGYRNALTSNTQFIDHKGCVLTMEHFQELIAPESLLEIMKMNLPAGQKDLAVKDWKGYKKKK